MREECPGDVTDSDTLECAELFGSGDEEAFTVCTMGGGCVFDVLDITCDELPPN